MTTAEIAHRARKALTTALEARGVGLARPQLPSGRAGAAWVEPLPKEFDQHLYCEVADRILSGRFDLFAVRGVDLGFPPPWNSNPLTGVKAPLLFGKTINYRDERVVGDVKYLWEPNRHSELVTLAQAWHMTADTKYLAGCQALLESWIQACPYPLGPNWTSALEHGLRLVNWAVAWHLVGGQTSRLFEGDAGRAFRSRWLTSIYCHCHFIAGHLSRHSSANNHLLGELMGLYVGSLTWPLWGISQRWREFAHAEFFRESLEQTAQDGVNREQAIWYEHEVADMMLLVGLFSRANGIDLDPAYWQRLERMLEFVASLMDVGGHVPMIGDADDAVMVRLSPDSQLNVYRSLLATGAVIFKRADFKAKAGDLDDKTKWLLGDDARNVWQALPSQHSEPNRTFPDGGYFILGQNFERPDEIRIVADAGPLGYLSIAAHGHADALAFTLSVGGREVLIDPGTYAYSTLQKWRDYFRGTMAHNTIRIDGEDQSVSGGSFMWLRKASGRCLSWETNDREDEWTGEHDGYARLKNPVTHRRSIRLSKRHRKITVVDAVLCTDVHVVEQFWHFAETCEITLDRGAILAQSAEVSVRLQADARLAVQLIDGDEDIPLGWISRRYGVRVPAPTVRCSGQICGATTFTTEIYL